MTAQTDTATSQAGTERRAGRRILRAALWIAASAAVLVVSVLVFQALTWPDIAALANRNPRTTAFIERYRERSRDAGQPGDVSWHWVPGSAISPHLKRAVVVAEDIEFFSHDGFSASELKAALREAVEERTAPRGASTITQQLAKNLWLSPSRNPLRKLKEAILTRQLERRLSKGRILDLYLNVVEFGPGIYGAEAAARHYFGRPASALTEYEAAQLAASLPRPSVWNPARATAAYRRYVAQVEGRMDKATFLYRRIGIAAPPNLGVDTVPLPDLEQVEIPRPFAPAESLGASTSGMSLPTAEDSVPKPP